MPKPRFTTAAVRAATGLSPQDVKNLLARGLLISAVEPARQGHDRHWSFPAAAELALLAAYRRAGIPPVEGLSINLTHLPTMLQSMISDSGTGWFALTRGDEGKWTATELSEPQFNESAFEDLAEMTGGGWVGDPESRDPGGYVPIVLIPARLILKSLRDELARLPTGEKK